MSLGWPRTIRLVRHVESVGNVDSAEARRLGLEMWRTEARDPDVALSDRGLSQVTALGAELAGLPEPERAEVIWCSPFLRAQETARLALGRCPPAWQDASTRVDERLRDRELGVLDRLTWLGITSRHPELAELRRRFGKFYFRPPGGESWADVGLRVRSVLADLRMEHADQNVLIFAHDVVVLMFRYVLEDMSEAAILDIGRTHPVANGAITTYRHEGTAMRLEEYNRVPTGAGASEPVEVQSSNTGSRFSK